MHLIMFDIDGTLLDTSDFDAACYLKAAKQVLRVDLTADWEDYEFATDTGILDEAIIRFGITGNRNLIHRTFKQVFAALISEGIARQPNVVQEITGAAKFLRYLQSLKHVNVAIATGGWEVTAKMKLKAANIDVNGCSFASSSDHYRRTDIMTLAELKASGDHPFESKVYFGDAQWDQDASKALNYKFILVGHKIKHDLQIDDYRDHKAILSLLGIKT